MSCLAPMPNSGSVSGCEAFSAHTSHVRELITHQKHSQNSGQNCIGLERLIVHESLHDEVHQELVRRVSQLRQGSALSNPNDGFVPTVDVGAMISHASIERTHQLVQVAIDQGCEIEGGERYMHPYLEHGSYYRPTVIADVDPESPIAQQECKSVELWRCLLN